MQGNEPVMPDGIFTLEPLEAAHGDALLLHYGPVKQPRLIIIDGGPSGIYKRTLGPRLEEIRRTRATPQLEIRLVLVSHIDDDHIQGIIELTTFLIDQQELGVAPSYDVLTLWHNTLDDLVAPLGAAARTAIWQRSTRDFDAASQPRERRRAARPVTGRMIAASVPQGRKLRANAEELAINLNSGFNGPVSFEGEGNTRIQLGEGLTFEVLGPRKAQLNALQRLWDAEARKRRVSPRGRPSNKPAGLQGRGAVSLDLRARAKRPLSAVAAEFVDNSIPNLSSIVVLARYGVATMLLTGDARGDYILQSLREAGLLSGGRLHVNILKVPHHGSDRDVDRSFFEKVTADHYVFSANGRDGNPDPRTFGMLFAARPRDNYTLWLTNPVETAQAFINKEKGPHVKLAVRRDPARSIKIDLGSRVKY